MELVQFTLQIFDMKVFLSIMFANLVTVPTKDMGKVYCGWYQNDNSRKYEKYMF